MNTFKTYHGILLMLFASCNTEVKNDKLISATKNMTIYEIMPRQYSAKKNFLGIMEDLDRIQNLFFTTICLLPVQERDDANNAYNPGTPFAIKNYEKIDPVLGDSKDLKLLIDSAHKKNMLILIHWNFTGTGPNHDWRIQKPEYYKSTEKLVNNQYNRDYVKFDLTNTELQNELLSAFRRFVREHHFDGVVLYNAEALPRDFIVDLHKIMNDIRPMLCINYSEEFQEDCDLQFNHKLFHKFRDIYKESLITSDWNLLLDSMNQFPHINFLQDYLMTEKYGPDTYAFESAYKYFHMLTYFLPGVPWVLNGQEFPQFQTINLFSTIPIQRGYIYNIDFYRKLNYLRKVNTALWNSDLKNLPVRISDSDEVLALERSSDNMTCVGLFNLRNHIIRFTINKEYLNYFDALNKTQVSYPKDEELILGPFQAIMFTNTPQ